MWGGELAPLSTKMGGFVLFAIHYGRLVGDGRLIEPPKKRCPFFFPLFWVPPSLSLLVWANRPTKGNKGKPKKEKRFKAKLGFWEGVPLVGCPIPYPSIPPTKPKPQTIGQKKRPQNGAFLSWLFFGLNRLCIKGHPILNAVIFYTLVDKHWQIENAIFGIALKTIFRGIINPQKT